MTSCLFMFRFNEVVLRYNVITVSGNDAAKMAALHMKLNAFPNKLFRHM